MKFGQVIYDAFGQFVCGFDILRHGGKSYICDVNGWSFVKNAPQYSQNCAHELNEFIQAQLPVHLNQA
jgi:glutathione synthase/RimK-type ligase-like ATP-grasp enzyme